MDKTVASYAAFLALYIVTSFSILSRWNNKWWAYLSVWAVYAVLSLVIAVWLARDLFDAINLSSMACFLGGVGLFAACAYCIWPRHKKTAIAFSAFGILLAAIGIDAFAIEPHWLEVRHEQVTSRKITKPFRIVVLSDLQTDRVGEFEESVLNRVLKEQPDMVLLPGDYIQAFTKDHPLQAAKLHDCLKKVNLRARLGVYATEGDSEKKDWVTIFQDLPVTTFAKSSTISVADNEQSLALTGLTLHDSWKPGYKIPGSENFHIVVAHRPDFMVDSAEGDLLVAGHTHGGQIQIPFFGPIVTFSQAPREWCGGSCIRRAAGQTLVITRGVGMERGRAPRIRFFCRPEIVSIDVVPAPIEKVSSVEHCR